MLKLRKSIIFLIVLSLIFGTFSMLSLAARDVIGISIPALGNPFWERVVAFTKVVAEQLDVDLKIVDCQQDEVKQVADIENLIAAGVKGLVVTPQTDVTGPKIISLAEEANIPIAITDRWPNLDPTTYPWSGYCGFIGPDDETTGYDIAKALIEEAGAKKIVSLSGRHGLSVTAGRYNGLLKALAEHPEVTLLASQFSIGETGVGAIEVTENLLAAYPDQIEAIWTDADLRAVGAVKALIDAGITDISVAGMDLNSDAIEFIDQGKMYASFGGHWLQDGFGLIMVYDTMNGVPPAPEFRIARLKLMRVVKADVDKFNEQFVISPPAIDATKISKFLNPSASGSYTFDISMK